MKAIFWRCMITTCLLIPGLLLAQENITQENITEEMDPRAADILAPSQEFDSIGTEAYYLAPVENSEVEGYVQAAELFEGGTKFVVSMQNTLHDYRYAVVLYEGDCGPDRPEVVRLGDINNTSGDPNTSIPETDLSFDILTQGDYFMYVFAGEPGSQILACGEVGVGANKSSAM